MQIRILKLEIDPIQSAETRLLQAMFAGLRDAFDVKKADDSRE